MSKNNSNYWRERFKALEEATFKKGQKLVDQLTSVFNSCAQSLDLALFRFYKRFSDMEDITLTEAKKLLNTEELKAFKMTLEEYIKLGESQNINYSPQIEKFLEEASLKVRVTRLEALSYEMSAILARMMGNEHYLLYEHLAEVYQDRYYRTAFTVFKNYGVGTTFAQINRKKLESILKTPWADDGTNFSERIWNNQYKLTRTLDKLFSTACVTGQGYTETSEQLSRIMGTNLTNATRLVVTEEAYFSSVAEIDCFKELGADEYEFIATLDETTEEECQALDGKVFKNSEFKVGATAPPIHPNCRCVISPHFDDSDVPGYVEGTRTARNKGGKTYRVPRNMKYPEWRKKYIDNDQISNNKQ